ncbi:hypothetical protein [Methylobacterium sp. 77]|uniref:hypothetical protein n=1 Tax=Methylobacterium sp. 77 TaxID=1101192 RepID=UPI0012DD4DA6|nr:hypothetical protein [Methylobacterium sp. 77]
MLTKDNVINAAIYGILNANDFYEKISNGFSIDGSGVEGLLQTKIAEAIFDMLPKDTDGFLSEESIVLEHSFKEIFAESGAGKSRGRIPKLVNGAKRIDILIMSKDGKPLIPIEVKRNAAADGFAVDANRIFGILKRSDNLAGGSVKFGLICGFISGRGHSKSDCLDDIKRKKAKCIENIENSNISQGNMYHQFDEPKKFEDEGWWVGGAICVYLRRQ